MSELLSICIPTRNRAKFLREILASFERQVKEGGFGADQVVFYFSDNASDDETPEVIREFEKRVPKIFYSRNQVNLGADGNNVHVRTLAKGQYLWVIGDDEILCEGALATILRLIQERRPGLIIAFDTNYELKLPRPQVFPDYRAFARECLRCQTHALAEHTLISCNIFRADCYDIDLGKKTVNANFPHMFGMIPPLMRQKAAVIVPETPIITVRKQGRPADPDGRWVDLDVAWLNYFKWLRDELELPELDPTAPNAAAREAMMERMRKHPVRFLANNWRSLFQPQAYRFVFNRLFRKVR
ncbi:MAG TPA: glycosyltransferase family A protein [Verrucomicrobiae bacterium]|nr:glycosyltransferase family A protein [Verrucomicrobiae bacterium]